MTFIDEYRQSYSVESICKVLLIAPSTYYRQKNIELMPEQRSHRAQKDEKILVEIHRVWKESDENYGAYKVWRQLQSESIVVARCTVERLMQLHGYRGVRRGGYKPVTTNSNTNDEKPLDLVKRQFTADAPNQLWVADLTYVRVRSGFVYMAFVIDVFSRFIVGWRVLNTMKTDLVLDAFEQALWLRGKPYNTIHHSDHGSQYLSIRYAERLQQAGFRASVGSVGDSYDNALAETINGLYKTEVIEKRALWEGADEVEYATLVWVDWFNNKRIHTAIDDKSPAQFEMRYYQNREAGYAA